MNKKNYKDKQQKELAYYLNLFKVKDHTTWRIDLKDSKEGFENTFKHPECKRPNITDIKTFRVDRLTGKIEEIKADN